MDLANHGAWKPQVAAYGEGGHLRGRHRLCTQGLGRFFPMEIGMGSIKEGGSYDLIWRGHRGRGQAVRTVPGRRWGQETGRRLLLRPEAAKAGKQLVMQS